MLVRSPSQFLLLSGWLLISFLLGCAKAASNEEALAHSPQLALEYTVRPSFSAQGTVTRLHVLGRLRTAQAHEDVSLALPSLASGGNRSKFSLPADFGAISVTRSSIAEIAYSVDIEELGTRWVTGALGSVFSSPDAIYITGELFALPTSDRPFSFSVNFDGFPSGWRFGSGLAAVSQSIVTTRQEVVGTQFVAGKFRTVRRSGKNFDVDIFVLGDWSFADTELGDLAGSLLASYIKVWGDRRHIRHLLIVHQAGRSLSAGASGRAFRQSTFIDAHRSMSLSNLSYFVAHEISHQWNARAFGLLDEPGALLFWFIEGFSDYYAWRLRVQLGVVPLTSWASDINTSLLLLARLKPFQATNAYTSERFFIDPMLSRVPYARGAALALKWNSHIVRRSQGHLNLDDALKELLLRHLATSRPLGRPAIIEALQSAGVETVADDINRYIVLGEPIVFEEDELAPCFSVKNAAFKVFELGFDADASRRLGRITGVRPETNASKAGIRDGQHVRSMKYSTVDPDAIAEVTLIVDGADIVLRFAPFENIAAQVVTAKLGAPADCASAVH